MKTTMHKHSRVLQSTEVCALIKHRFPIFENLIDVIKDKSTALCVTLAFKTMYGLLYQVSNLTFIAKYYDVYFANSFELFEPIKKRVKFLSM